MDRDEIFEDILRETQLVIILMNSFVTTITNLKERQEEIMVKLVSLNKEKSSNDSK